jgi:hypothetical protein
VIPENINSRITEVKMPKFLILAMNATSHKVAGLSRYEAVEFVPIYLIIPAAQWSWSLLSI